MAKAEQGLRLPKILYIETTNRCNLRCKGCLLYRGSWEPDRDMTLPDLIMITDQLPALERATLHGVGEPLLNTELCRMIAHLKKRNVFVLFNSNGILLELFPVKYQSVGPGGISIEFAGAPTITDDGGDPPSNIPEPSILALFGISMFGLGLLRRRRKNG